MTPSSALADYLPDARGVTHHSSRTFWLATRFLPVDLKNDVCLLYLVCRTIDDLVDSRSPLAAARLQEIRAWLAGGPARAREETILADLLARHPGMPAEAIADFCLGQEEDLQGRPIKTEADLDRHSYLVAGTVGRLMAGMLGACGPAADDAARALGIAMQRTNILRDIDEDLGRGRVYLPAETLARCGIANPGRDNRRLLLREEIAIADAWYDRGLSGLPLLARGRRQVRAAALLYREILREIERESRGEDIHHRAIVPPQRKIWLLARAMASR